MQVSQFGQREEIRSWQRRVQDILDEMRKRSFCDYRASGAWLPTINIYANDALYHVCVELAGIDHDSVSVECPDARHLRVSGERIRPHTSGLAASSHIELMEIDEGPFHREIDFADEVDATTIEIAYTQGYLWITLRKAAAPRQVGR